ncbi:hypothetical protein MMC10_009335 [Thelotrema lepadinum]|nr:hypothetical protein [Thelotrema lepadinum]
MWLSTLFLLSSLLLAPICLADWNAFVKRDGVDYEVFEHSSRDASLEFVKNPPICETTPGVNSYAGYIHIGENSSMFFWFFESRKDPSKAPLGLWLNGGPGCSSMEGLFQETGPCYFTSDNTTTPVLNPYSFNEYANMLYVDQPVSVGFSYGTDIANSSSAAAAYMWTFLQSWYDRFPSYENRDFSLFTESYGGHMGPTIVDYILSQNAAVKAGDLGNATEIPVVALGINDGCLGPKTQFGTYAQYAYNNSYVQIINETYYNTLSDKYSNGCKPALAKCAQTNSTIDCVAAAKKCNNYLDTFLNGPFTDLNINWYDVQEPLDQLGYIPPMNWVDYLLNDTIMTAIGARKNFTFCSNKVSKLFDETGDNARSPLPALNRVVNAGVRTLIWVGDADWICNYLGSRETAHEVSYPQQAQFRSTALQEYTVNGTSKGLWKGVGNLSYMQVYKSGHQLPYYQRALALQVFTQMMQSDGLYST